MIYRSKMARTHLGDGWDFLPWGKTVKEYSRDQVDAALGALRSHVSASRAAYQAHFNAYRAGAAAMTAAERSAATSALERENRALGELEKYSFNGAAARDTYLGALPLLAIAGTLLVILTAVLGYLFYQRYTEHQEAMANAEQQAQRWNHIAGLLAQGKITPQQFVDASKSTGVPGAPTAPSASKGWIGVVVVGGLAVTGVIIATR